MSSLRRRALLSVMALLTLALIVAPVSAAQVCEGCGLSHEAPAHGGPITLTDWTTNETHTYLSLDCAVQAMRETYTWSRARWTTPAGQEITLTRAQDRWDADPVEAVAIHVQGADDCDALVAFAGDAQMQQWLDQHAQPAHSEPVALAAIGSWQPPAPEVGGFTDVPADHWAAESVEASSDAGLLSGDPDGAFHGDRKVSRYEMAMILQRLLQYLRGAAASGQPGEVATAIRAQLQDTGAPDDEVAEIVQLAADPATPTPPTVPAGSIEWPDVPAEHWAAGAVEMATATGFMNGYPDGNFRGEESLSRYEIAVILRRLIDALGLPTGPIVAEAAPRTGLAQPALPGATDQDTGPAQTQPVSPSEGFLQRLQQAGFTREEAERALSALQAEVREPAPTGERLAQAPSTAPQTATRADATAAAQMRPRTTTPGLLGQSGLLMSPTADTLGAGQATLSASSFGPGDSRAFAVSAGLSSGTEVTATVTSGDLPDAIVLSARQPVYRSADGRTRAAVGVMDITDEIDTTAYGVVTWDAGHSLGGATLNAGIGGGELLDGLFVSGSVPIDGRITGMVELLDIGDEDQINAGLSYRATDDLNVKAGVVDGDFAASISYDGDF